MASEERYQRYRRLARYPLFLAGLTFILGIGMSLDPHAPTIYEHQRIGRTLTLFAWAIFLVDYVVSLLLTPDRRHYFRTHLLQGIGVIFPPLRILLIFHVTYEVVTQTRGAFGHRLRLYLLYVSTLVILVSSTAVLVVERNAPGATIVSYGDALWWAAETVSTVGYGDMYPVTFPGRLIAVSLMINGFAILSVLTATLSQAFLNSEFGWREQKTQPQPEPEI